MISYPYTYINHQNQPSMYVNLNNTWILWEMGTMYNHVTCLIPPQKKKNKTPWLFGRKNWCTAKRHAEEIPWPHGLSTPGAQDWEKANHGEFHLHPRNLTWNLKMMVFQ